MILGVDTGGTFTDFVLFQHGQCRIHKVLSTPQEPAKAILQGIAELELSDAVQQGRLHVIHGSTVATNAALQGQGVSTVYVGNRGFTDLLYIGRQNRDNIYELHPGRAELPLKPDHCLGCGGRVDHLGKVIEPLTEEDILTLRARIKTLEPEAIAINLLFSYVDDRWEKALQRALEDLAFTTRSSFVLPEYGEYERGMATFLNAWLGPVVREYLQQLGHSLAPSAVSVMQSSGGTISSAQASQRAVNLLVSGPAGGLAAAVHLGARIGRPNLMTFDMGGTSTDVSLIQGTPVLTNEGCVGPYPVAIPMADIHTIGAGGGSIAFLDEGGSLQVGPESAGADPGPACYGRGGRQPTVTDANVVLGRLPHCIRLGGSMALDKAAAFEVLEPLAASMQTGIYELAQGICDLTNEHMARALRVISLERGYDPTSFSLLCYGGAGGLHVCAVARQLQIDQILIPSNAGVFSAFGMLVAKPSREVTQTWNRALSDISDAIIERAFSDIAVAPVAELAAEGGDAEFEQSIDVRYTGQTFSLNLPWHDLVSLAQDFHRAHERRFGHAFDLPLELVNLKLRLTVPRPPPEFTRLQPSIVAREPGDREFCRVHGDGAVALYDRDKLFRGRRLKGPLLVRDPFSTTYVDPGWELSAEDDGHLFLHRR